MTVEQLEVIVKANSNQFQAEMRKVQSVLSQVGSATTSMSSAVGSFMTASFFKAQVAAQVFVSVLKKVGQAIWEVTKKVISGGSELSRMKVATDTVIRNMGITKEEVDGLRRSLADANTYGIKAEEVIKTLALSGLMDMAKSLQTVDARTGETVVGVNALVLSMKDLAAAAGMDSSEGIYRLTKFIRRGESGFADGIIELGNLNMIYRDFAKSVGKTTMELTEQEQAQARVNVVMEEARKTFGAYANTYLTSGKMRGSLRDATTSIFEELGASLEPIFATLSGAVLNVMVSIRNALFENADRFKEWATKVAGYIMAVIRILGTILSRIPIIGKAFAGLRTFAFKTVDASGKLAKSVASSGQAMDDTADSAKGLKKQLMGLATFDELNVLKKQEESGGPSVGNIGNIGMGGMEPIDATGFDESINKINEWADIFEDRFVKNWEKVKEKIGPVVSWLSDKWEKLKGVLQSFYETTLKPLFEWWGEIISATISPFLQVLWDQLKGLFETVKASPIGEIFKGIATVIGVILAAAITIVIVAIGAVIAALGAIVAVVKTVIGWFTKLWDFMWGGLGMLIYGFSQFKDTTISVFKTVWGKVQEVFSKIRDFVSGVINTIKDRLYGMKESFSGFFVNIVATIKSSINTIISRINAMIQSLKNISLGGVQPFKFLPTVPYLAQGGVVSGPTLAVLGEAGREAVVPLDNSSWMEELAQKIGGGQPVHLVVKIGEDTLYDKLVSGINDRNLRMNTSVIKL